MEVKAGSYHGIVELFVSLKCIHCLFQLSFTCHGTNSRGFDCGLLRLAQPAISAPRFWHPSSESFKLAR